MNESIYVLVGTVAGVLIGGIMSFGKDLFLFRLNRRHEAEVLAKSFYAEIAALLTVVKHQRFVEDIEYSIDQIRKYGEINMPGMVAAEGYFLIFDSNAASLGILKIQQAEKIVTFYTLAKGWVEDMRYNKPTNNQVLALERLDSLKTQLSATINAGNDAIKSLSVNH